MVPPVSADSNPLRVAVIGCGKIGNLHATAIHQSPHARLAAVCDPDEKRRSATARQFHCSAYPQHAELFSKEPLAAVTIATPDHLHVEPTLAALAAGCHVFCEKPLATSVADARRMIQAADARRLQLSVNYNRRFAFGYRTAKELLEGGRIGTLNYAAIRVTDPRPPAEVARRPEVIFTTLLTHHLDLMRFYGGEVRQLFAQVGDVEVGELLENVTISLKFASGALGSIVASYRHGQTRTAEWLELGGTQGAIVVEDMTRRVVLSGTDPDSRQVFEPNPFAGGTAFYDSLIEHVQSFVAHIARGESPPVTAHDGLAGMQLAESAIQSLATAVAVEVHP